METNPSVLYNHFYGIYLYSSETAKTYKYFEIKKKNALHIFSHQESMVKIHLSWQNSQ